MCVCVCVCVCVCMCVCGGMTGMVVQLTFSLSSLKAERVTLSLFDIMGVIADDEYGKVNKRPITLFVYATSAVSWHLP